MLLGTRQTLASSDPKMMKRPWLPSLVLGILLLVSVILALFLINSATLDEPGRRPFLFIWIVTFLPYFAACAVILKTRPATGRWIWVEWACILLGAVVLRALFIPLPPNLSRDSWRYLWDARVTLHGFSPYVYAPNNKLFVQWQAHDLLYFNSRFRNVPSLYPPTAQAIYLLSYLIAPSNLPVLKGIFMLFDLTSCGLLMVLLRQRKLDPRLVLLYAWCPLPIVEFAMQGHVDVITITFMLLALWSATKTGQRWSILTGFLVAMATLTKFYPLLLLVVVVRRRDWLVIVTCLVSIALSYIPFLMLGHGQILGFFSRYASEQGGNAGPIQLTIYLLGKLVLGMNIQVVIFLQTAVSLVLVGSVALIVLIQRWNKGISAEGAVLLLISVVFACSSHVFPWYTAALLPWIATGIGPLWAREAEGRTLGTNAHLVLEPKKLKLQARGLIYALAWYFPCISILGYFCNDTLQWYVYDIVAYGVVIAGLGAIFISKRQNVALLVKKWVPIRDKG